MKENNKLYRSAFGLVVAFGFIALLFSGVLLQFDFFKDLTYESFVTAKYQASVGEHLRESIPFLMIMVALVFVLCVELLLMEKTPAIRNGERLWQNFNQLASEMREVKDRDLILVALSHLFCLVVAVGLFLTLRGCLGVIVVLHEAKRGMVLSASDMQSLSADIRATINWFFALLVLLSIQVFLVFATEGIGARKFVSWSNLSGVGLCLALILAVFVYSDEGMSMWLIGAALGVYVLWRCYLGLRTSLVAVAQVRWRVIGLLNVLWIIVLFSFFATQASIFEINQYFQQKGDSSVSATQDDSHSVYYGLAETYLSGTQPQSFAVVEIVMGLYLASSNESQVTRNMELAAHIQKSALATCMEKMVHLAFCRKDVVDEKIQILDSILSGDYNAAAKGYSQLMSGANVFEGYGVISLIHVMTLSGLIDGDFMQVNSDVKGLLDRIDESLKERQATSSWRGFTDSEIARLYQLAGK